MNENGRYLVPEQLMDAIVANLSRLNPYYQPLTWEERLAIAIRERSIRQRWRVFRWVAAYRLRTALDVLRGSHVCGDDW